MIYHLAVHQSARKQGVGALLLNEVEERLRAKGCLKSYLLVKVDNESAMDFYKRRGWKDMNEVRIFGKDLL
jgi:ribosomal protein S18 acetylase RimI-like enzyme